MTKTMNTPENEKKLDFLNKLLEKNPGLQQQFNEFMNDKDTGQPCDFDIEKHIQEEAVNFTRKLEILDLDEPDWEFYTPRHNGYIPEWEARTHMAEDMIAEKFEELKRHLEKNLSGVKTDLALFAVVAAYDACLEAGIQDEYETLYDHETFLLETLKELQRAVIDRIQSMVIPNRQVYCFFQGLLGHFKKKYHDDGNYLRFFEPLLLCLIREKERAQYMENLIKEGDIPRHFIPRLVTEIYRVEEDRDQWIEEAERLFEQDVDVARNLLTDYIENSYDDFIRVAERLWKADLFKHELADLIFKNISREKSPVFYKNVLVWLTSWHKTLSWYILLRNVLSEEEKDAFIQEHKHNHVFYTGMLYQEKRYPEILQFVRKHVDSWHLNEMITTILEPYPEESFEILKKKALNTVETERGRSVYERIVQWLLLAQNIKNMDERTSDLINRLYHWQPRLPALRDELKKAGLVK